MRLFALLGLTLLASAAPVQPVVDRDKGEVRFPGTVQPHAMERWPGVRGHHAIVWSNGRSSGSALFVTPVSDREVRAALDGLGALRGENLSADTWNARKDRASTEPDKRVEGSPIDVFVEWNGSRVPLGTLITEKGQTAPVLDFRYGGNEAWQREFRSGCIVCLYSCPGGAVGNHARTIRDYVRDGVIYASLSDRLPPNGTPVTLVLKIRR